MKVKSWLTRSLFRVERHNSAEEGTARAVILELGHVYIDAICLNLKSVYCPSYEVCDLKKNETPCRGVPDFMRSILRNPGNPADDFYRLEIDPFSEKCVQGLSLTNGPSVLHMVPEDLTCIFLPHFTDSCY